MKIGHFTPVELAIPVVTDKIKRWPSAATLRRRIVLGTFPEVGEQYIRAYEQARTELNLVEQVSKKELNETVTRI